MITLQNVLQLQWCKEKYIFLTTDGHTDGWETSLDRYRLHVVVVKRIKEVVKAINLWTQVR